MYTPELSFRTKKETRNECASSLLTSLGGHWQTHAPGTGFRCQLRESLQFRPKLKGSIKLLWQPTALGKALRQFGSYSGAEGRREMSVHTDEQSLGTKADKKKRAKKCLPSFPFRTGGLAPILLSCVSPIKCHILPLFFHSFLCPFLPASSQFSVSVFGPLSLLISCSFSSSLKVHVKIPALIPATTLLNLWYGSLPPLAMQRAFTWPRNILYNATFYQNQIA